MKHLKTLEAAGNEIEIKFGVQRVNDIMRLDYHGYTSKGWKYIINIYLVRVYAYFTEITIVFKQRIIRYIDKSQFSVRSSR